MDRQTGPITIHCSAKLSTQCNKPNRTALSRAVYLRQGRLRPKMMWNVIKI